MSDIKSADEVRSNVRSTISTVFELAFRCGLEPAEIQALANEVLSGLKTKETGKSDLVADRDLTIKSRDFLSAMNTQWQEHEHYVDDHGRPLALPSSGQDPSIHTLYEYTQSLVGPAPMSSQKAMSLLVEHEAVAEAQSGLWKPTSRAFSVNKAKSVGVNVQLSYLAEYADTIRYNADRPRGSGRFCTVARVSNFPKEKLKGLQVICNDSGMSFLEEADAFLLRAREDALGSSMPKTTAGVGVYFFEYS